MAMETSSWRIASEGRLSACSACSAWGHLVFSSRKPSPGRQGRWWVFSRFWACLTVIFLVLSREWGINGGMGLLLIVMKWIIPPFLTWNAPASTVVKTMPWTSRVWEWFLRSYLWWWLGDGCCFKCFNWGYTQHSWCKEIHGIEAMFHMWYVGFLWRWWLRLSS